MTTPTDDTLPPPPEPVGFRVRYQSEPGMIGHYPWTYADHRKRKYDRPSCEYQDLFTADQMRAYRAEGVAQERERHAADADDEAKSRDLMRDILQRTAVALKGPEPPNAWWGWGDLVEIAQAAARDAARYRWLRDGENECELSIGRLEEWDDKGWERVHWMYDKEADAAIDASIRATTPPADPADRAAGDQSAGKTE